MEENKRIVRRFFEVLAREQRLPEEMLGIGFTYHVAGIPDLDLEATRKRAEKFVASFSDSRHILQDLVAEGDRVAFRSELEMTHTGEFMGVAVTNKQLSVVEMGILRIEAGKIAEMWGLLDSLTLMQQIGAIPSSD